MRTYQEQYPPIKIVNTPSGNCSINNSLISGGCAIEGAAIENSILSPNVKIQDNAEIKNSVIMESVRVGDHVKIQNAIIDKEVNIPPHTKIGYDPEQDRRRFALTTSGIVIAAKKAPVVD